MPKITSIILDRIGLISSITNLISVMVQHFLPLLILYLVISKNSTEKKVINLVVVKISETYDLSTTTNKMGMIAIHTPTKALISKMYPGFYVNYGKMRVLGTDCVMACASVLPADPLQVGVEAGDIAPEDMFNPILYTAVSNDSFNTLQSRLYTLRSGSPEVTGPSVDSENSGVMPSTVDEFNVYYALLSDTDKWARANPQAGLSMTNLRPLVFPIHSTLAVPEANTPLVGSSTQTWTVSDGSPAPTDFSANYVRGHPVPMPSLPTTTLGYGTSGGINADITIGGTSARTVDIPQTYLACIIMPPSRLSKLYYRLVVTTSIEFSEPRSAVQLSAISDSAYTGFASLTYGSDYINQSKSMDNITGLADTENADIKKVM